MRRSSLYAAAVLASVIASPCAAQQKTENTAGPATSQFEGVARQKTVTMVPAAVSGFVGAAERDPIKVLQAVLPKLDATDDVSLMRQEQVITFKAGRIRIDLNASAPVIPALPTYGILVRDSLFMVLPSMSRVMVASQGELGERAKRQMAQLFGADTSGPTVADLGTRSLHGVQVHGYRVLWPTRAMEIWFDSSTVIPGLHVEQFQAGMDVGVVPEWIRALPKNAGFVVEQATAVRAPAALGGGWMVIRTEAELPVHQPVADSLFAVPAGLERVPMPDVSALPR